MLVTSQWLPAARLAARLPACDEHQLQKMSEYVLHLLGPFTAPGLAPRLARVYVPPGRSASPRPLLCVFDGQNVFHDEPSFAGGWHLHRAAERMAKRGEPAPIIVGLDHGGHERIDELSPFPTKSGPGRLPLLRDLFVSGVLPLVERTFGATTDPSRTAIGGSSMGGLAALWVHETAPFRFGLVMSMSPSLHVGQGAMFDWIASRPRPAVSRIYLDAGGREAGGAVLRSAERLARTLEARGYDAGGLLFVAAKRGAHDEKSWRRRAPRAIRFLFGGA